MLLSRQAVMNDFAGFESTMPLSFGDLPEGGEFFKKTPQNSIIPSTWHDSFSLS
jgi:hypothetical protein